MIKNMIKGLFLAVLMLCALNAWAATEEFRTIDTQQTAAAARPYSGVRQPISVGKFDNRSNFMRGRVF